MNVAYNQIRYIKPAFQLGEQVHLKDLDSFLSKKYRAVKADWKDIDKCTKTKVKRFNKHCKTVFCVSEGHVSEEEYHCAYIINRENCINPSTNKDDFFMIYLLLSEVKIRYIFHLTISAVILMDLQKSCLCYAVINDEDLG